MIYRMVAQFRKHWIPIFFAIIWAVVLSTYSLLRHNRLNSSTYDLGIKAQVIWNTWQGDWFASTVEVTHYLGDHVQLIFLILAPLFGLWEDARILLILQAVLLSLGVIPLYRIALRCLEDRWLAAIFGVVYLLYPLLGFVNRFDFHPLVFTIPLFLAAWDALETDRLVWANIFVLLALSLREEVGLTVCVFGIYTAIFLDKRRIGSIWAIVGLGWSLFALFSIIPHFRSADSDTISRYSWLGESPQAILTTIISWPNIILNHLAVPYRAALPVKLLLPVGFLSLLAPAPLLIAIPSLAYNMLSQTASQSSIYFQYMAPAVPFVFVAAVHGAKRVQDWLSGQQSRLLLTIFLVVGTMLAWVWDNPFTKRIDSPFYPVFGLDIVTDVQSFQEAKRLLPPDADVATMMAYGPHLALRPSYSLFYDRLKLLDRPFAFPQTDYLLLNLTDFRWRVNARIFYNAIVTAIGYFNYEVIYSNGDVVLLQRNIPAQPQTGAVLARVQTALESGGKHAPTSPDVIETLGGYWVLNELPPESEPAMARFADGISLVGYDQIPELESGRPFCLTLYWRTEKQQNEDFTVFVHLVAEDGYVQAQSDSQPVFGYLPTSEWESGKVIADLHCLLAPPGLPEGSYNVHTGLYNGNNGQRLHLIHPTNTDNAFNLAQVKTRGQN